MLVVYEWQDIHLKARGGGNESGYGRGQGNCPGVEREFFNIEIWCVVGLAPYSCMRIIFIWALHSATQMITKGKISRNLY